MTNERTLFRADIGRQKGIVLTIDNCEDISRIFKKLGEYKPGIANSAFHRGYVHVSAMIPGRDAQAIGHAFSGYVIKDRTISTFENNYSEEELTQIRTVA